MYNKLIQGKPGKRANLDALKMQRLTEIGFQFRPRGGYLTWEEQMEKLQKFKEENGTLELIYHDSISRTEIIHNSLFISFVQAIAKSL
jgi:hypothetical protein